MKESRQWVKWPVATWGALSLSQIVLLIAPFVIILLGILIIVFQLNRQLYDQQQVIVNRLAHAVVRHTGQLQREHLRLWGLISSTGDTLVQEAYTDQHNLVVSRIQVLELTLKSANASEVTWEQYHAYREGWEALQPLLARWQRDVQNSALKSQIGAQMAEIELHANQVATLVQASFESQMGDWARKSLFLNFLLTIGSFSFIIILLLVSYGIFLLFRQQSNHQDTLRTSEQRLRVILDAIPDAVYRVSGAGIYTDYKPAINQAHRLPETTFFRKHLRDVLPPAVATAMENGIKTVLAEQQPLLLDYPLVDARHNLTRHYEARLLPSGVDEVQIIVRDVTEVKQQEEATIQAQKLESLGVLAGGIAHDFNNLLTGMLGQASLAVAKLNRGLPALDHVEKVVLSAERAADLTKQLLAYTGKGKFQIDLLDLNRLITDTTALMGTVIPGGTDLRLALQDPLPPVRVDRGQIQQVAMNLFINAIEALPDGNGSIVIATGQQWIDETSTVGSAIAGAQAFSTTELPSGRYVFLRVEDTGIGMDQATLSRIFDPFFSTKSKGHGLGLSATLGIVRTHQGALWVQSKLGEGTVFTLLLPACLEDVAVKDEWSTLPPLSSDTQQSVLIIDDETPVREAASDILSELGFHVTVAASGTEGVELYRDNHQQIDIVLLDMKMPGLNGTETYRQLQQIEPNLKVIFTSGYSDVDLDQQIHRVGAVTFLPKPYTAEVLTKQIHRMLLA
ncbi:MAG TPA: response regulator [Caldilineaceae bacterium]|nr:response regulator [Caldilineaceae bacterium]